MPLFDILKERLAKWDEYEAAKNHLESFIDEIRLKLTDPAVHHKPATNAAESVRQALSSAREMLVAVECHQSDLERLQQMTVMLKDTASEACQITLHSDIAALTDAMAELTEMLMQRVYQLEMLDQRWTELYTQTSELTMLLADKQKTLEQTMHDTGLTPDQRFAAVKVSVIFMQLILDVLWIF